MMRTRNVFQSEILATTVPLLLIHRSGPSSIIFWHARCSPTRWRRGWRKASHNSFVCGNWRRARKYFCVCTRFSVGSELTVGYCDSSCCIIFSRSLFRFSPYVSPCFRQTPASMPKRRKSSQYSHGRVGRPRRRFFVTVDTAQPTIARTCSAQRSSAWRFSAAQSWR